jgi:hypothetical protein
MTASKSLNTPFFFLHIFHFTLPLPAPRQVVTITPKQAASGLPERANLRKNCKNGRKIKVLPARRFPAPKPISPHMRTLRKPCEKRRKTSISY